MDLNEVKNLINNNGERVILVESGKPTVVFLAFEDYKKLCKNSEMGNSPEIKEEKENKVLTPQFQQEENKKKDLTLEDLPF